MKRILSIMLSVLVVASMFTTVSADLSTQMGFVPTTVNEELSLVVSAREGTSTGAYTNGGLPLVIGAVENDKTVDYKTVLNMAPIRALFSEPFITTLLPVPENSALNSEFNGGAVSTSISIAISFPAVATITGDLTKKAGEPGSVGTLDAGTGMFSEVSRTLADNTLTITYKNKDSLTVGELRADVNGLLKDITFTLDDAVAYSTDGSHQVSVTLSGSTKIVFASRTQIVNYNGASSHIVTATKEIASHVLKVVPVVPATCTSTGYTEGVICMTHNSYGAEDPHVNCGAKGTHKPVETPKLPHNAEGTVSPTPYAECVHLDEVLPTCSTEGVEEHYTCVFCKQDFQGGFAEGNKVSHESLTIAKLPHTNETIPAVAATCTKTGLTAGVKCSVCSEVITKPTQTPKIAHTLTTLTGHSATCTQDGLSNGKKCSVCSAITVPQKIVAATGHSFGAWSTVTPAGETTTGLERRDCSNGCGHYETRIIPETGHINHVASSQHSVVVTPATCDTDGVLQKYCACGQIMTGETEVIPKLGHKMTSISAVPATCSTTGTVAHYECANCHNKYRDANGKKPLASVTESKNSANHGGNIVALSAVAATCEKHGLTEGSKCKACNTIITKQELTPIANHVMENIVFKAATCTTNGVTAHKHCTVCNKDFAMDGTTEITYFTIPAKGHHYGDIQVATDSEHTTTATPLLTQWAKKVCNDCGYTQWIEVQKEAHSHNEIAEEIITPETCTTTGLKRQIYACCGEVVSGQESIIIPAHAHSLTLVPIVNPTCFKKGQDAYYVCSECHKMFSSADSTVEITAPTVLDVTTHNWVDLNANVRKCSYCNEVVHKKVTPAANADVKNHGGIKNKDDAVREDVVANIVIESNIVVDKKDEISATLETVLPENVLSDKIVLDIVVEKVTTHTGGEKDIELIPEVDDLIEVEINIPAVLQGKTQYNVIRLHNGVREELSETPNIDGEYIEIDRTNHKIIIHAKKFSEYAIVAFDTTTDIVLPETVTPVGPGGSSTALTVKFNSNGGTEVESISVNNGKTIEAPVTTRPGYTFKGWYTDNKFTTLFDFSTKITRNLTLYAGWEENAKWFTDVHADDWFYDIVKYAYANGLMNGVSDTEFAPNMGMTRAMFVTVLYRIEKEPDGDINKIFNDVVENSWYDKAVAWATENGITKGVSETEFDPDRIIIREQIVTMVYRYAKFKGYDVSAAETTDISSYEDADAISEYAVPSFKWAVGAGVIEGKSDVTLCPKDNTTRAEAAAILTRLVKKYN